jgi:uncharacterized protein with FMN-binding domain
MSLPVGAFSDMVKSLKKRNGTKPVYKYEILAQQVVTTSVKLQNVMASDSDAAMSLAKDGYKDGIHAAAAQADYTQSDAVITEHRIMSRLSK